MNTGSLNECTRRQAVIGGAVATAGLSSGCLNPIRRLLGLPLPGQVSLRVAAYPADWDKRATLIAKQLTDRLERVGIATSFVLLPPKQLREQILYRRNFDVYVGTMPLGRDPDFMRPLLQSTPIAPLGWQNPFGFTDLTLDERLDAQRRQSGATRGSTVAEALDIVANEQPFMPLVIDQAIAGVATDRFEGWSRAPARDPTWLLEVDPAQAGSDGGRLRMTTINEIITNQLNPLTPWINEFDVTTSLLYDPLARYYDGKIRPWLAESWSLDDDTLTVTLREDLRWHDGRQLTAEDVRFTYRFLSDTALGSAETEMPSPRFQSQASVIGDIDVVSDREVRMNVDAARPVAERALTAPLLPGHIWRSRTEVVDGNVGLTQAITANNRRPVGCGPMAFESRSSEQSLELSRYGDHPLNRDRQSDIAQRFGPLAFSKLTFVVTPSNRTEVSLLRQGRGDVTVPSLDPEVVPRITDDDDVSLMTSPSRTLYHVGFNLRRKPLRYPQFRHAIARLLEKDHIATSIFDGYADPIVAPMADQSRVPETLQWNGSDPIVQFAGSDGNLDVAAARENFRTAGYNYADDGRLFE